MMSLNRSCFLGNPGVAGSSSPFSQSQKRRPASLKVVALIPKARTGERNGSVVMESTLQEVKTESEVVELKSTVHGGVKDVYGEDTATEDQLVTPWSVSVASGYTLIRSPHHNKGLAFTEKERDAHYLRGLLPPVVISQELQVKKMINSIRQYQVPLQKYIAMMDLQGRNEKLFYKLLIEHVEELLPVVYTPTVGEACQKYGSIFTQPQGLFISLKEKGKILEVLRNWPELNIQVIVVTDGERILGLGDLGSHGMGIPVGKLALYTALGGVRPSACLPVTIDVGTNNEKLLNDEFYIGLRQKRATGQEYAELLHEFMTAVKQNYGEKVLVQFEDFANHNAFDLLAKYASTHLVFNDDIQGTASVVLAGLLAALKIVKGSLSEHRFLFLGAGEAGTGIAELIALEISKQTNTPVEETRKNIWLVDSKGLIVSSRLDSLQHFKKPWAHEHEPVGELVDAVKSIKPTVLIGTSGVGRTFTKEVVEAMASLNERPIILALSNPTSQSECTAEEAYTWTEGRAIYCSGSPFPPVEYNGKVYYPGQANNAYIFPGFGLGLIMSGTIRVHDDMLLAASEALASMVTQEDFDKGLIYPPFTNIRKISAHIAAKVAAKSYELGLATRLPEPRDLEKYAESCMYSPSYRSFRQDLLAWPSISDFSGYPWPVSPIKGQWKKKEFIREDTLVSVYLATNRETGALCKMKEVDLIPDNHESTECTKQMEQEIKILRTLTHPNIVQYYGSEGIVNHFCAYLEYVPVSIDKSVQDHIGAMKESVVCNFTRHIPSGLAYLHGTKTIHRDIRGANLRVDASGVVKLVNFGLAKHLNGQSNILSFNHSPNWMAPEVMRTAMQKNADPDFALTADMWSFGCTIIEMFTGRLPWSELIVDD